MGSFRCSPTRTEVARLILVVDIQQHTRVVRYIALDFDERNIGKGALRVWFRNFLHYASVHCCRATPLEQNVMLGQDVFHNVGARNDEVKAQQRNPSPWYGARRRARYTGRGAAEVRRRCLEWLTPFEGDLDASVSGPFDP